MITGSAWPNKSFEPTAAASRLVMPVAETFTFISARKRFFRYHVLRWGKAATVMPSLLAAAAAQLQS